jgi:hypothetical protein
VLALGFDLKDALWLGLTILASPLTVATGRTNISTARGGAWHVSTVRNLLAR